MNGHNTPQQPERAELQKVPYTFRFPDPRKEAPLPAPLPGKRIWINGNFNAVFRTSNPQRDVTEAWLPQGQELEMKFNKASGFYDLTVHD